MAEPQIDLEDHEIRRRDPRTGAWHGFADPRAFTWPIIGSLVLIGVCFIAGGYRVPLAVAGAAVFGVFLGIALVGRFPKFWTRIN
jgi:hypothetical protein